ncbi:MAG: alkaline phosphatase [Bacteroidetes bacterium]|nr:alkaline phosphatase [Bacteroidota bacterium]
MTKKIFIIIGLLTTYLSGYSQYTTLNAHSHNDYQNDIPFWSAYYAGFGSIEADIWAVNGELMVAHQENEINAERTLDQLYIQPIVKLFKMNGGKAWGKNNNTFQLVIELKSAVEPTLSLLVRKLDQYPEIFNQKVNKNAIQVTITGKQPAPSSFDKYPDYIYFDGNLNQKYSEAQLKRVPLFSLNLKEYTKWNGKANIPANDVKRISKIIDSVHQLGSKIRFWGAPDIINAWKVLINLQVDYLNTDKISKLAEYLNNYNHTQYTAIEQHIAYLPTYAYLKKPMRVKNVILLIGDGMGLAHLYAGYTANMGALSIFNMLNIGFSKTSSADSYVTDSGAGGSAFAIGEKTNNRSIGVDALGITHENIPELLSRRAIKSAIISVGDITDATPAVFYAHQSERDWAEKIADDFMHSPVDILMGGNPKVFTSRKDGRNLLDELKKKKFQIIMDFNDINKLNKGKAIVLDDKATCSKIDGRSDFLPKSVSKSCELLTNAPKGFFMMAEGAQIDYGGHRNDMQYVIREMLDFDLAVSEALKFADKNNETLVIVTADHETGGITLLDGNYSKGMIDGQFSTNDHTGIMVPVFAYGPHSEDFRGVYENTEIFKKIITAFGIIRK